MRFMIILDEEEIFLTYVRCNKLCLVLICHTEVLSVLIVKGIQYSAKHREGKGIRIAKLIL